MAEVLQSWIRQRLGVLMDMSPELFGHYTRNGRLLAQILHSYGIINSEQLETIVQTRDPAICRVNLKLLRLWLRFVGVECTDQCIDEISCGRGATALQLFYKVYLSLEDKDSLHFITLQKEREKYIPSSTKFDVIPVSEEPPPYEPLGHPLSRPLREACGTIEWYRSRLKDILKSCEEDGKQTESPRSRRRRERRKTPEPVEPVAPETPIAPRKDPSLKELDDFAQKHRVKRTKEDVYDPCQVDKSCEDVEISAEDPETAKAYISWLKSRKKKENIENATKSRMQNLLLNELWESVSKGQEKCVDESLARRVLHQSHYEKQMLMKLGEVRSQKNAITENRRIVDQMTLEAKERRIRLMQDREREEMVWESDNVDMEYQRMWELHRRIRKEKLKKLREKHERMCLRVVQDLADIAVKAAEYRSSNEGWVPKAIWNEWKALFLKLQPIFEPVREEFGEDAEGEGEDGEEAVKEEELEEIAAARLEREEALNEADFESYHTLGSPWDEYVPFVDEETQKIVNLGEIVLGYIVHKLLEFVYPYPVGPIEPPIPKVKVAAIVLGLVERHVCLIIQTLLIKRGIHVVRMEDAINYCLLRYKEEMTDVRYIDENIVKATEDVMKRPATKRTDEISKKTESAEKSKKNGMVSRMSIRRRTREKEREKDKDLEEKETQTPRTIPYDDMDPVLSDAAYVGKWTYEFLVLGQPISNELNTRILIEYLKSLGEIHGWALVDYPNTYDQMARLEFALTGQKVPPDPTLAHFDNVNVEDIDPASPRIVYEDTEFDEFASYRLSKLLPNPISREDERTSTSTFATTYVRVIPKPKNLDVDPDKLFEILPEDATAVDEFYTEQSIAYVVYYDVFDSDTLKKIARLVTGDKSIPRTSSVELFGNVVRSLEDRKEWSKISAKESIVRRLLSRSAITKDDADDDEGEEEEMKLEDLEATAGGDYVDGSQAPRPGEEGWDWVDFPQSPVLLDALATLWENLEEVYILDLMEIFSLKRLHSTSILPYKEFIVKNMNEFIERPDTKQDLLIEFQTKFNDVDEDVRDDEDLKCELHCRLNDFQKRLWDICDLRRQEAEEERKKIIGERWTDTEAVLLVNIYVSVLQAEIDRCVDTLQMVQDYYISMLQRPIQEARYSKILLDKVKVHSMQLTEDSGGTFSDTAIKNKDTKDPKNGKSKTPSLKGVTSTLAIDPAEFSREIALLFTNVTDSIFFDPSESSVCKAILDNVEHVREYLETVAFSANESLKKEENFVTTKGRSSRRLDQAPGDSFAAKFALRGHDLVQEWRYAYLFEINRMRTRLEVLAGAAHADVSFLLDTMRLAFHRIYERIIERYEKEKKSVDEMTKIFGLAIEEGVSIEEELVLDGERFYVRSCLPCPDETEIEIKPTREATGHPSQFRMSQLGRLMNVFKMIAPGGTLTERSLVYVLQDMISYNMEEEKEGCDGLGSMPVPFCWRLLRACDVPSLVERIFGRVEYIEWREFIIYAMDLPMPTQEDILQARDRFRTLDIDLREIVTRDQYRSVPLWFFKYVDDDVPPEIGYILHDDFQRSFEDLFDEEIDFVNPNKSIAAKITEKAKDYVRALRASKRGDEIIPNDEIEDQEAAEEALRLMLAKELLCQMYLTDRYSVNYTALLLAFCKDENPNEGLGKALSLSIGRRVCTDVEEGEKYVEKLLEEKRLAAEMESMRDYLREEALLMAEEILNNILEKVITGVIIEELDAPEYIPRKLMIEKLDEPGEIDTSTLMQRTTQESEHYISDTMTDQTIEPYATKAPSMMMYQEGYEEFSEKVEKAMIHWLPYGVCLAVLSATLPWHASQSDLFKTGKTLRRLLRDVFDELYDEEISDDRNTVLSHRFLNHDFVIELLDSTSKFTVKHLGNIFSEILEEVSGKGNLSRILSK